VNVVNHPYFGQYATVEKMDVQAKTKKTNAINNVCGTVYAILWHFRVQFANIRQKKKSDSEDMDVPSPCCTDVLAELQWLLNEGIRVKASSLKNNHRQAEIKEQVKTESEVKKVKLKRADDSSLNLKTPTSSTLKMSGTQNVDTAAWVNGNAETRNNLHAQSMEKTNSNVSITSNYV
jgi:hypothetical protein